MFYSVQFFKRTPQDPYGKWLPVDLAETSHRGSFQHADQKSPWARSSKNNITFASNHMRMLNGVHSE